MPKVVAPLFYEGAYSSEDEERLRNYVEARRLGQSALVSTIGRVASAEGSTIIRDFESYVKRVKDWMRNPNPVGMTPYDNAEALEYALNRGEYVVTPLGLLGLIGHTEVLEAELAR